MFRQIFGFGFCLLSVSGLLFADELHLRDGRVIIGNVSEIGDEYLVERGANSQIRFPRDEVRAVEKKLTREERYENLLAITDQNDAQAVLKLARWCRENRLVKQAKIAYQRAVEIAPENSEARKGAGYIRQSDGWITYAEQQTALGKTLYRGKWIDAGEAAMLSDREQRNIERTKNRGELQRIITIANHLSADADTSALSKQLAALEGDGAWSAIERAAGEPILKIREVAYGAVAIRSESQKLELLAKRLRIEENPRLAQILISQLREYSPRDPLVSAMLNVVLRSPAKKIRERAGEILAATGDRRLIDKLIAKVDFCPVEKNSDANSESLMDGWDSSERAAPTSYYPAHELLVYLTGQTFKFNEREKWQDWWTKNRDGFTLSSPAENSSTDRRESHNRRRS